MKTMFDIGAYDGHSSIGYAEQGWTVYAFEPHPVLAAQIRQATKHLPSYHVIQKAASDTDGHKLFNLCNSGGASSLLSFKSDEELGSNWPGRWDIRSKNESVEVETIRLDTFISEKMISCIDILHVDAQGHDLAVLRSLGEKVGLVQRGEIEVASHYTKAIYKEGNGTIQEAVAWFFKHGFYIESMTPNDPQGNEFVVKFTRTY